MRRAIHLGIAIGLAACATAGTRAAMEPIDWAAANERWSLHVVSVDPDGDERVTRVWIAVVDGTAAIRTGDTRWLRNLQRDPNLRIRVLGVDHPLRVRFETDEGEIARIDAAFLDKYGWQERLLGALQPGNAHDHFLWLVPRTESR